jgi:nucleotide-binding universal stress UspA family protein
METLLVATDFSSASRNAAFYAIDLAKHLGARVALCHAYQAVLTNTDMALVIADEEVKEASKASLLNELQVLKTPGVEIEVFSEEGWTCEAVLHIAKEVDAKWILAGIKGSKVTGRKLFGSSVTELSRHSNRPLILVPENAKFSDIRNIALASDLTDENDVEMLDPLHEFAQKFNTRMYVVRVIKKGMDEVVEMLQRPALLKSHFKDLKPTYEFEIDNDVADAMNKFVREHHVDMIVMVKQDHSFLERLFTKSATKEMIFEASVPVVILPNKLDPSYPTQAERKVAEAKV